jgi:hypothetical protein
LVPAKNQRLWIVCSGERVIGTEPFTGNSLGGEITETEMALIEDLFKGSAMTGIVVGVGALMLAPTVIPAVGRVLRPAVKAAIKGGMVLYNETIAEIGEAASDLVAEARAELEEEAHAHAGATPAVAGNRRKTESR